MIQPTRFAGRYTLVILLTGLVSFSLTATAQETGGQTTELLAPSLLSPDNSAVVFLDFQPTVAFAVQSIDRQTLINNTVGLAEAAKALGVPVVLSTVQADNFSGPMFPELRAAFPNQEPVNRQGRNAFENEDFVTAVEEVGRQKLVIAGLWTEVCLTMSTLSALAEGYEVYIVTDASGGTSEAAHQMAVDRLVQAGAVPVTWLQVMLEYAQNAGDPDATDALYPVIEAHGGTLGLTADYAQQMLGQSR